MKFLKAAALAVLALAMTALGQTMHDASAGGNIALMDSLYAADHAVLNAFHPQNGATPLHYAAYTGQAESLTWLLDRGADAQAEDRNGSTPMVWALSGGRVNAMKTLAKRGVDLKAVMPRGDILLHLAGSNGNEEVINFLIDEGLDVNAPGRYEMRPLHYAVFAGKTANVKVLLERGARPMQVNQDGETPFFMAVNRGQTDLVQAFLDGGVDPGQKNRAGDTPLHAAAYNGHQEVAALLVQRGAGVNEPDGAGQSALAVALSRGLDDLAAWLTGHNGIVISPEEDDSMDLPVFTEWSDKAFLPVKVTVIYDNFVHTEGMESDWGFSLLIETEGKTILFDTGTRPELFIRNFDALHLNAEAVDVVVLSHEHGDHTGGLWPFLERRKNIPVVLPYHFSYSFVRNTETAGGQPVAVDEPVMLSEHISTSGEMGSRIHEQCLVVNTEKGLVVITGCSHPGIVDMLKEIKDVFGRPVYMVFGGFHLMTRNDAAMAGIISEMKALGVVKCGATHCTGEHQIELFKEAFGEDYVALGVGNVLQF